MVAIFIPQHFLQNITNVGWSGLWLEIFVHTNITKSVSTDQDVSAIEAWPINADIPGYGSFELGRAKINLAAKGAVGPEPDPSPNPSDKAVLKYFKSFTLQRGGTFPNSPSPPHPKVEVRLSKSGFSGWVLRPPKDKYPQLTDWPAYAWWPYEWVPMQFQPGAVPLAQSYLPYPISGVFYTLQADANAGKAAWIAWYHNRIDGYSYGAFGGEPTPNNPLGLGITRTAMKAAGEEVFVEQSTGSFLQSTRQELRGQWHYLRVGDLTFPKNLAPDDPARSKMEFNISVPKQFPEPDIGGSTPDVDWDAVEYWDIRARLLKVVRGAPNADPPVPGSWPPYPEWETVSVSRTTGGYGRPLKDAITLTVKIDRAAQTVELVPSDGRTLTAAEVTSYGEKVPREPPLFPLEDFIVVG